MKHYCTISILICCWAFTGCQDDPEPAPDFELQFNVSNDVLTEGGGFDESSKVPDFFEIGVNHDGELEKEIAIGIAVSGTATAGEDYSALPDTIYYNPYINDQNGFSFKIIDDLEYEGEVETVEIRLSYDMNGTVKTSDITLQIRDNDFRFTLTWTTENGPAENADLDLLINRGHNFIFFTAGTSASKDTNSETLDLSGSLNKWGVNTGYGMGILYQGTTGGTGTIRYDARFYLPDGQFIQYEDSFEENDYTDEGSRNQLAMIVLRVIDLDFKLMVQYQDGSQESLSL